MFAFPFYPLLQAGLFQRQAVARTQCRSAVVARAKEAGCGIMGTKAGMTTVFTADGIAMPCTVIALEQGNIVTQVTLDLPSRCK